MLTVLRDANGYLHAVCEWWLVDAAGHWTPDGQYVFLHQLEISPGVNLHAVRKSLVAQISLQEPHA